MNAVLKIDARAIERPAYDNDLLGREKDWIQANSDLLRLWWNQCGQGVGPLTEADYRGFCFSQHEIQIEIRRRNSRRAI